LRAAKDAANCKESKSCYKPMIYGDQSYYVKLVIKNIKGPSGDTGKRSCQERFVFSRFLAS